jgi:ribosomal-protein-serine acetyltransferase
MFSCPIDDALELRPLDPAQAAEMYAVVDANRAYLRQWMGWVDNTRSADDIAAFIRRSIEQHARDDGFVAGVWHDGRIAGTIGMLHLKHEARRTEIGYWLAEALQGRGIITRCCRRFIDHLFDDVKLNRVEIRCAAENHRSRAVPRRLGFTEEGVLRQVQMVNDQLVDHVVYGMLADEWGRFREEARR